MANFFSRFITAISRKLSALIKRVVAVASPRRPSAPPPPPPVYRPPPSVTKQPPSSATKQPPIEASSQVEELIEVPDPFTVERIENGYRASGPLKSGWYINVGIEGDTVRSNTPFLDGADWPFEWTDSDPEWIPAEPPVKWFVTHSDHNPHIPAPIGGIKEIYQGRIDVAGISSQGETVVEVNTQEEEDARRAKNRRIRRAIKKRRTTG